MDGRQIRIEKAERVWGLDYPHPGGTLLVDDLVVKGLHPRPMNFRPEMVFSMVTIIKPSPVVQLVVGAHAPGNRLVGIATVMPIVAVQVREAVTEVPERQKKTDVMPVENAENNEGRDERRELKDSPECFAIVLAF